MNKEELYKILENNLDTISCREVIDYIEKLQEEKEKYKRYVDNDFLYTYEELQDKVIKKQQRIDKAIDKLKSMLPMCIMPNNMLIHGTEKARIIEETVNILEGKNNEED